MKGVISYKTPSRNVMVTFSELDDRYQEKIVANNTYEGGHFYKKKRGGNYGYTNKICSNNEEDFKAWV